MPKVRETKQIERKPRKKQSVKTTDAPAPSIDLDRLEFFRHGYALMPSYTDRFPAIAYNVDARDARVGHLFCSCRASGKKTCEHLKALSRAIALYQKGFRAASPVEAFRAGFWHRLAVLMADGCRETVESIQLMTAGKGEDNRLVLADRNRTPKVIYLSDASDRARLIERLSLSGDKADVPTRADVLQQLAVMTMSENEAILVEKGMHTARQTLEGNFWYRLAYHLFKEFGEGCRLQPAVDEATGEFMVSGLDASGRTLFYFPAPRSKVKRLLTELKDAFVNQHGMQIQPLSLDTVFDVKLNEGLELEIQPLLRLIQKNGELQFFKREDLKKFQYGDLYYIKELGMLVEDQYPAPPPGLGGPARTVIQRSRVPQFLADHAEELKKDLFVLDERVRQINIMSKYDRIEITPGALEREWCLLSVIYGDGDLSVSLADIVRAKQAGQRFVRSGNGWVDCNSPAFAPLDELAGRAHLLDRDHASKDIRLSRADLLRLRALSAEAFSMSGARASLESFQHLLDLKPMTPVPELRGMTSLRGYQQRGVQWLWFLHENHFGGLLCDDMGLGKTHQIMALMVALREAHKTEKPFLVVCPTSVLSHWENKIGRHATALRARVHHGGQRDLDQTLEEAEVVITSYGILRRDIEALAQVPFAVAVFDEVQNIKNADTLAYRAAVRIDAEMKIGATGTPIENRLDDLKSLLDISVPGYLGSDEAFRAAYQIPIEENDNNGRRKRLSRLIAPFILRRLKKTVLDELPDKIEDVRSCHLSETQVRLYRDAVERNGRELQRVLAQDESVVPYIHIFALLNLLKQICNHPALVEKNPGAYQEYASGKWDLFTELLAESLDSGQKVVVYSQYLGMIDIIAQYLTEQKVGFVSLTGASRKRGEIIARFDRDPDCRVFVGSLKAGGVGIDLMAASVVIHYDRWWNAAREDQATDRVHRIGQRRGVQVFKLVTEGTLEEKIAAIIERKRGLMEDIIKEDDPGLVKTFTREELLEMIAMPVV